LKTALLVPAFQMLKICFHFKNVLKALHLLPTMVPEVISTLKTLFGRPDQILDRLIEKAKRISVSKDRLDSIIDYALAVRNICATMEACQLDAHLNNPMLVREMVDKLPNQYKMNWALHPKDGSIANVKAFSDWLYKIAEAASTVVSTSYSRTSNVHTHTIYNDVQPQHAETEEHPHNS